MSNSKGADFSAGTLKVEGVDVALASDVIPIAEDQIVGRVKNGVKEGLELNEGQVKINGSAISQTVGPLIVGQTYEIINYVATDDFTNVGASANVNGEIFEATGTTPTDYSNGSELYELSVNPVLTLVANVEQQIIFGSLPLALSSEPTNQWPQNILAPTDSDIYKTATDTFIENTVPGQINQWRVIFNYSGKALNNNAGLQIKIRNTLSGFQAKSELTLPSGETGNTGFLGLVITIADGASLPAPFGTGQGYQLWIETTSPLVFELTSFTRITHQKYKRIP